MPLHFVTTARAHRLLPKFTVAVRSADLAASGVGSTYIANGRLSIRVQQNQQFSKIAE